MTASEQPAFCPGRGEVGHFHFVRDSCNLTKIELGLAIINSNQPNMSATGRESGKVIDFSVGFNRACRPDPLNAFSG